MNDLAPVLRLPSAIAAAATAPLTAVLTRQFGWEGSAQLLAAGSIAVSLMLLGAGHMLSTTTFDLLAWVLILLLVVVILRGGDERLWLVVGLLAGAGLLDDDFVAFLMAALLGGITIAGPRRTFRSPWLWTGGIVQAAIWAPCLAWQARHGWPELTVSRGIANGASGQLDAAVAVSARAACDCQRVSRAGVDRRARSAIGRPGVALRPPDWLGHLLLAVVRGRQGVLPRGDLPGAARGRGGAHA